jgi:hypothetical protein
VASSPWPPRADLIDVVEPATVVAGPLS